jgi:hypothetical protein
MTAPERISLLPDHGWIWMEGTSDHEETAHEYILHTRAALETSPLVQAIVNDAIIKAMNDAANGDSHDRQ